MIGDRLDTDTLFGNHHGIDTLLVLTGVHTLAEVQAAEIKAQMELMPKYFAQSVRVFVEE